MNASQAPRATPSSGARRPSQVCAVSDAAARRCGVARLLQVEGEFLWHDDRIDDYIVGARAFETDAVPDVAHTKLTRQQQEESRVRRVAVEARHEGDHHAPVTVIASRAPGPFPAQLPAAGDRAHL